MFHSGWLSDSLGSIASVWSGYLASMRDHFDGKKAPETGLVSSSPVWRGSGSGLSTVSGWGPPQGHGWPYTLPFAIGWLIKGEGIPLSEPPMVPKPPLNCSLTSGHHCCFRVTQTTRFVSFLHED